MELTDLGEVFPILGSGLPRTAGLHLTDIIRYVQDTISPYTGKGFDNPPLTMEMGFIWEDALSFIEGKRLGKRLSDLQYDGIYMNPDGLGYDPLDGKSPVIEEYKCTWKSMKNPPTHNPRWLMQVKGYCKPFHIRIVVMYVLYINGDYRGSGPRGWKYRIEFTHEEIEENWKVILDHKEATLRAIKEERNE